MVAPGELILVDDNDGGVTRASGISFAAPLVAGAAALIHDRWPWMKIKAEETVTILLESAVDLGDPGVDGTYGHGLLDVEASQSPLDFNRLFTYLYNGSGVKWKNVTSIGKNLVKDNKLLKAQNKGMYVVAYERIGSTYRDFYIPLSSSLVGDSVRTLGGRNKFQSFIFRRMMNWTYDKYGISDAPQFNAPLPSVMIGSSVSPPARGITACKQEMGNCPSIPRPCFRARTAKPLSALVQVKAVWR